MVKNLSASAGDLRDAGLIPGSGRSPEEGNGYPLQYSCLENSMDRGALASYHSWGHKELDATERLTHTHTHIYKTESLYRTLETYTTL